jgi:Cu2+-exporting ATPase
MPNRNRSIDEKMSAGAMNPACDLCGLDCGSRPLTRRFDADERRFCCLGCANVYAILLESGVIQSGQDIRETELFKRSLELGLISTASKRRAPSQKPTDIPADAPVQEALLQISGMWCSSCAWLIEHALMAERGVVSAEAFFASDLVKVKFHPQYLPTERITARIHSLGYTATPYTGENLAASAERRDLLLRIGVAGFLWLNIMTLSMALYVGYFERISDSISRYLPFVLMALATPVVVYSARPIFNLAWRGLRNRWIRMETLLAIGILAAYAYSAAQAFRGETHLYFDTAAAIVTLVLAGKLIERNAKEKTSERVSLLYRMMPKKARLMRDGRERFVAIDALGAGDVFVVKAGERIPADGLIVDGNTHTDESLLTGESAPVAKREGGGVVAGSVNITGVIQVRATKVGTDTTLAQIIQLVERAMSSRLWLERTVDRVTRVFVPSVILLAAMTFMVCWLTGAASVGDSLMRAITVLVIACPCALGIATPLAITAAIGSASSRGILVSDSRVLETIHKVDSIILDKTGTVTEGNFALLDHVMMEDALDGLFVTQRSGFGVEAMMSGISVVDSLRAIRFADEFERDVLPMLAALERYSEHPLGSAVVARAEQAGAQAMEATEVMVHKGRGITGTVAGHRLFIGNRQLIESEALTLNPSLHARAGEWERAGYTVAFFGWNSLLRGLLVFGDSVKADAAQTVAELKRRGVRVRIVSGDAAQTTEWVAAQVCADEFIAEASPEGKRDIIEQLQAIGQTVAVIGDGINDAPALAQADLGIAMGSGADIAMRASAMVLMNGSLSKVIEAFDLSRKAWRVVRQNLFWAFFYNAVGITLAVTGLLNPILAAGAMLCSSLSVIGNSLRLMRTKD